MFIFPQVFFNSNFQVMLGFANLTSITASIGKLPNNVGLRKFKHKVFRTEKTSNFFLMVKMLLQY